MNQSQKTVVACGVYFKDGKRGPINSMSNQILQRRHQLFEKIVNVFNFT